jgi:hypothetical protein
MSDTHFRRFRLRIGDKVYTYRGLTQQEIKTASSKKSGEAELYILNRCVEGDHDWENTLAGITERLLSEIYKISGLTDEQVTIKEAVEWITSETGGAEAMAISVIHGLTLETLHNCCPFTYAKYLILGKYLFETLYGIPAEQVFLRPKDSKEPPKVPVPEGVQNDAVPVGASVSTEYTPLGAQQGVTTGKEYGQQVTSFTWHRQRR